MEQIKSMQEAPIAFASYIIYSSMIKSFLRSGRFTIVDISFKYLSLPRNHLGSVSTEIQSAPAFSYSFAIERYGKSFAIMPLEGEAFLHSHIKERPGFFKAFSKLNLGEIIFSASALIKDSGIFFFCSSILHFVYVDIVSKIVIYLLIAHLYKTF